MFDSLSIEAMMYPSYHHNQVDNQQQFFQQEDYYSCSVTDHPGEQTIERGPAPPTPDIISTFANYEDVRITGEDGSGSRLQATLNCVFAEEYSSSCSDYALACTPSSPPYTRGDSPSSSSGCLGRSPPHGPLDSISATRSKLIKEGLKLTIQSKRRAKGLREPLSEDYFDDEPGIIAKDEILTEEDEDRRKRRRERNKVAATKCRNKKKERTQRLAVESTSLESSNGNLKDEIGRLEGEKRNLLDLLRNHLPLCAATPTLPTQERSSCAHVNH